jgi:hypothetical protein
MSGLIFESTPTKEQEDVMKGGYESIVWIKDKDGKEYACYIDDINQDAHVKQALSSAEQERCLDVNELVGTERW